MKIEMNREEFDGFIETLKIDTQTTPGNALLELSLWPKYKNLTIERFEKICKWLTTNYEPYGNRFPTIAYFEKARRETSSYSPDTFTTYVNKKHSPVDIKEAFQHVKKALPVVESKTKKKSQVKLMIGMEKAGKIYDVKNRAWIDKKYKSSITSGVVDPTGSAAKFLIKGVE